MQQLSTTPDIRMVTLESPRYRFETPFGGEGFVLLLHSDDPHIGDEARAAFAEEIVRSGCRFVCCSGAACGQWETAVSRAFAETDPDGNPPDEGFILSTSHDREAVREIVWFALHNTSFDDFWPRRFLLVLLSPRPGRAAEFAAAIDHRWEAP